MEYSTTTIVITAISAFVLGFIYCLYLVRIGRRAYNKELNEKLKYIKEGQAQIFDKAKETEISLKERIAELEAENKALKAA